MVESIACKLFFGVWELRREAPLGILPGVLVMAVFPR